MALKSAYQMLPHEILEAREASSCAFVPVSPCFEWHSFHLPVGTDALIAEGICRCMAERVHGLYFEPLSFGLDEYRPADQLTAWGFNAADKVFGMRFPDLPLCSEYCRVEEMKAAVNNRLEAIHGSGFRFAFIVNNHGGAGQMDRLNEIAAAWDRPELRVFSVTTYQFIKVQHESMQQGGHAGQSETLNLMAFRPELVDFARLPAGELNVRKTGILHYQPTIEACYNPRHVMLSIASEIRHSIVEAFVRFIQIQCKLNLPARP
jgi:creatinine amidohydrolase/Fe(II)-dependent formamide hydrolase-like protein